jgi:hypothetical protein
MGSSAEMIQETLVTRGYLPTIVTAQYQIWRTQNRGIYDAIR